MDPFNIKIEVADEAITLTILPVDNTLYKVVYYGAILGAVRKQNKEETWEALPIEELTAGDLPFYRKEDNTDHQELELDPATIAQIGKEIEIKNPQPARLRV
jgi:hypothetical protein